MKGSKSACDRRLDGAEREVLAIFHMDTRLAVECSFDKLTHRRITVV